KIEIFVNDNYFQQLAVLLKCPAPVSVFGCLFYFGGFGQICKPAVQKSTGFSFLNSRLYLIRGSVIRLFTLKA
ncbi:hypothetical protein, partial [Acinetobacter sp.]